ncbi:signal peptidase I [Candidatus Woesearchaeota archaeon]|nr:signal peptidase I [Candidatus Woesearchaeota archaeon]
MARRKPKKQPETWWGKAWHFIWYEDSIASWAVNVILAFLIIKFLVYPLLSVALGTSLPIVAVVSESMDHGYTKEYDSTCNKEYELCGHKLSERPSGVAFQDYWERCGDWYEERGITAGAFRDYPFSNGFSKGDIIILAGEEPEDISVGEVIVFQARKPYPIIHRVVDKHDTPQGYVFETKGDHNPIQISGGIDPGLDETDVREEQVLGVAKARVPYLGWVKVGLVELITPSRC